MAKKKWIILPGGHIKRWKPSVSEQSQKGSEHVPPHWYRNHLNRKERQKSRAALGKCKAHCFPYIHAHTAGWYW